MLPSIAIAAFNHVLRGESWARKRLQSYAGKSTHLSIFPLIELSVIVQTNGELALIYPDQASTDASIVITPSTLPRLISRDESAFDEISIKGDTLVAKELIFVIKHLHWDIEQDVSTILGDILAYRMIKVGKNLIQWQSENTLNLSQALIEYLTQEKSALASHTHIASFTTEVSSLQEQVTYLEKRITRLFNLAPLKAGKNISL